MREPAVESVSRVVQGSRRSRARHAPGALLPERDGAELRHLRGLEGDDVPGILCGRLDAFSPVEVLQMLDLRGRGAVVAHFESAAGVRARVYVREHVVVHAELGQVTGAKALSRLLGWQEGAFRVDRRPYEGAPSIALNVDHALLASLAHLDEQRALSTELARVGARYGPCVDAPEPLDAGCEHRLLAVLALVTGHGALQEILDHSPYSDADTMRLLRTLVHRGVVASKDAA